MEFIKSYNDFLFEDYTRSVINYMGNKYKLLPQFLHLFPKKINTFVDMFCGSLTVSLNVNANIIIANDKGPGLIELYKYIQKNNIKKIKDYLYEQIKKFNLEKATNDDYLKLVNQYNTNKFPLDLFLLQLLCFNGHIRFNLKGVYNKAFGNRTVNMENEKIKGLDSFKNKIEKFTFEHDDFYNLPINKSSFFYGDPPYLITDAVYNNLWNENEDAKLMEYLDNINTSYL